MEIVEIWYLKLIIKSSSATHLTHILPHCGMQVFFMGSYHLDYGLLKITIKLESVMMPWHGLEEGVNYKLELGLSIEIEWIFMLHDMILRYFCSAGFYVNCEVSLVCCTNQITATIDLTMRVWWKSRVTINSEKNGIKRLPLITVNWHCQWPYWECAECNHLKQIVFLLRRCQ